MKMRVFVSRHPCHRDDEDHTRMFAMAPREDREPKRDVSDFGLTLEAELDTELDRSGFPYTDWRSGGWASEEAIREC